LQPEQELVQAVERETGQEPEQVCARASRQR
jgi:hypothetical protein